MEPIHLLILVIIIALIFDYINGFHDSANAIATVIATKALKPWQALVMAGMFNFIGAFLFDGVAKTVGKGIINVDALTHLEVVLAAVLGAIIWNLVTWWYGLPSSSSHALIGGLVGAVMFFPGPSQIHWDGVLNKVVIPGIFSPMIGVLVGLFLMVSLFKFLDWKSYSSDSWVFKKLQLLSSSWMALSHGTNDATKVMGVITMALIIAGHQTEMVVPVWVKISCAVMMALGTVAGGWRIIHTMGYKITPLNPAQGFVAETTAGSILMATGYMGFPVSTTHVITGSIMGVGSARRFSDVKWSLVNKILLAWVLTIPATALVAALVIMLVGR